MSLPNPSIQQQMADLTQFDRSLTCMQQHLDHGRFPHWVELISRPVRTPQDPRQYPHRLLSVECKVPPQTNTIVCVGLFDPPTWDRIGLSNDGLKLQLMKRAVREVWSCTSRHQREPCHFVLDPNPPASPV